MRLIFHVSPWRRCRSSVPRALAAATARCDSLTLLADVHDSCRAGVGRTTSAYDRSGGCAASSLSVGAERDAPLSSSLTEACVPIPLLVLWRSVSRWSTYLRTSYVVADRTLPEIPQTRPQIRLGAAKGGVMILNPLDSWTHPCMSTFRGTASHRWEPGGQGTCSGVSTKKSVVLVQTLRKRQQYHLRQIDFRFLGCG